MMRVLAAGLGAVILVFLLANAGGTAVDHEVSDVNNTSADEVAEGTSKVAGGTVPFVPVVMAVAVLIFVMKGLG